MAPLRLELAPEVQVRPAALQRGMLSSAEGPIVPPHHTCMWVHAVSVQKFMVIAACGRVEVAPATLGVWTTLIAVLKVLTEE